ncbi:MAG TPA: competence protein ComEC, partial [Caulobacteraceae bacterium]|nr:competence protein ComEC [Caulobacteraceae bacterium]
MLSTRLKRLPSIGALGRGALAEAQAQLDRLFLWIPVAFGLGAAIYLGLKDEPPFWPAAVAAVLLGAAAVGVRWRAGALPGAR